MKRLTETAMFRELSMPGAFDLPETVLKTMYDDFAHAVMDICMSQQANVPAYFILHYTSFEFDQLTIATSTKGAGKKCYIQYLSA
mgnify:CR=1 FL=1